MKLIRGCLLALALLGCLADAQYFKQQQQPPQAPQQHQPAQRPQAPQQHQPAQRPQAPQQHQPAQQPQQPKQPQIPRYIPPQQNQRPPTSYQPKQPQQTHRPKQPQQPNQPEAFQSCDVSEHYKIQCGASGISGQECEAINCCFDGRSCYYGKSVTLQATKDAMIILVVARDATLPNLDLETITFLENGPNCSPIDTNSAFAIYQFPVTDCGTIMTEEPGVIIYENRMVSAFEVAVGPRGAITRDTSYELIIQCRYIGTSIEVLIIEVGLVPPPIPVAAPGPLQVLLRLGNGQCLNKGCVEEEVAYSSFYMDSDYPITKVLREAVYVDICIQESTDPNLALTLGRCWATTNPNPHSLPQWDLLIDGCPYRDDRYQTALVPVGASPETPFPTHHRRFIFKMFTFVAAGASDPSKQVAADPASFIPLKEKVYIHCDTAVCTPSLGNNCEPRCFRKRRDLSTVHKSREDTTVVTSLEIQYTQSPL